MQRDRSFVASLTRPQSVTIDSYVSKLFMLSISFSRERIDWLFLNEVTIANKALPDRLHSWTRTVFSLFDLAKKWAKWRPDSTSLISSPYSTKYSIYCKLGFILIHFIRKGISSLLDGTYSVIKVSRLSYLEFRIHLLKMFKATPNRFRYYKSSSIRPLWSTISCIIWQKQ